MIVEEKEQLEAQGFTIDPRGNWFPHTEAVAKKARKRLGAIRRIAHMLDDRAKMMAYKAFVRSKIKYGNLIYWGAAEGAISKSLTGFKPVLSLNARGLVCFLHPLAGK